MQDGREVTVAAMSTIFWIGLGGFLGANARYWLGVWLDDRWGATLPLGTLAANVVRSFVLALLLTFASGRVPAPPGVRLFLTIGLLGGFTTFSSFTYETLSLLEQESWMAALLNLVANTGLGLLGACLGIVITRWLQNGA